MKKLYSIALAASVALSASATIVAPQNLKVEATAAQNIEFTTAPAKAPAKAAISSMAELEGLYEAKYYSPFEGAAGAISGVFSIRSISATQVKVLGFALGYEATATVDFSKGTLTFEGLQKVDYNEQDGEDVNIAHFYINNGIQNKNSESFIWNLAGNGNIVSADPRDLVLVGSPSGLPTPEGRWSVYGYGYDYTLKKKVESTDWTRVGEAEFTDQGYVMPLYGFKMDTPPTLPCYFERNNTNTNLVRITAPFAQFNQVMTKYFGQTVEDNLTTQAGAIEFDITNPECVIANLDVFGGFQDADMGLYYFYNAEGMQFKSEKFAAEEAGGGISDAEIIAAIADFFGEEASKLDTENGIINLKNCAFGFTGQIDRGMTMNTWLKPEYACPETATFVLPEGWNNNSAIKGIEADNTNAPVEYFNLQGIRVANPENGVFIRRQGTQVTKVIR